MSNSSTRSKKSNPQLSEKLKVNEYYSSEDSEDELDKATSKNGINSLNSNLNQMASKNIPKHSNSLYSISSSSIGDVETKTKYSNNNIRTILCEKKRDEEKNKSCLSFFTFDYERKNYLKYWSDFSKNIEHNEENKKNIKVDWKLFYNKVFKRSFEDKANNFYNKGYYSDLDYINYINYINDSKNKKINICLEEFRLQIILNKLIYQWKGKYGDNITNNKSQNKKKSPEILLINRNKDIGYRGIYKNGISEKDKDGFIPLYISKLQKLFTEFLNKKKYQRKMVNIQLRKKLKEGNFHIVNKSHDKFRNSVLKASNKDKDQNNKIVNFANIQRCNSNFNSSNLSCLSPTTYKNKYGKKNSIKPKTQKGILLKNKLDDKKMSLNTNNINSYNCFKRFKSDTDNHNNSEKKNTSCNSNKIKFNIFNNNKITLKDRKSRNTIINNSLFFSRFNKKFTNTIANSKSLPVNKLIHSKSQNKSKSKTNKCKTSSIKKGIIRGVSTENIPKIYNISIPSNEEKNSFSIKFSKKELNNTNTPKEKNEDEMLELCKKNLNVIISDKLLLNAFLKKYPQYQEELNDLYNNYYLYEKVYEKRVNNLRFFEKNTDFNHYLNTFLDVRKKKNIISPVNQIEINEKIIDKTLYLQNLLDKINSE